MKQLLILLALALTFVAQAQKADKNTLLSINDEKISKDEFLRVYKKNNKNEAYTPEAIDEYLDLYINFRLKVQEAKRLGYHKNPGFINELEGYRKQLAKPYFEDNDVRGQLIKEAYNRIKKEVEVSHVLVQLPSNIAPNDTMETYTLAMEAYNALKNNDITWEEAIEKYADDEYSKQTNGYIGFISAFVTVYPFEEAAYNTPVGQISKPTRSRFGYHIVKVHSKRDGIGEIQAAHIFVKVPRDGTEENWQDAEKRINKYYERLENGENFEQLASQESDDKQTARHGGDLGYFKAGKMVPEFAEAAIAIDSVGQYSKPVKTRFGYHIIKLLDIKPLKPYDELKPEIEEKIKSSKVRNRLPEEAVLNKLKTENNFSITNGALNEIIDSIGHNLINTDYIYNNISTKTLFTLGDSAYTYRQFFLYLASFRVPQSQGSNIAAFITNKFNDFINECVYAYEDTQLEKKYPEFRYLVQEYHDGILLFNLMDDKIWSYASEDTSGLEAFYALNKQNYTWDTRAVISLVNITDTILYDTLVSILNTIGSVENINNDSINKLICPNTSKPCVTVISETIEKGHNQVLDSMKWIEGEVSGLYSSQGKQQFIVIHKILPPAIKKLNEARGLIIADYQKVLEDQWIKELRNKADIKVNTKLLKKIKKGKI